MSPGLETLGGEKWAPPDHCGCFQTGICTLEKGACGQKVLVMLKYTWRVLKSLKTPWRKSGGWDGVCPRPLGSWDRDTLWRDVLAELGSRGHGAGAQHSLRGLFPSVVPKSFLGPGARSLHMSLDHNCS